MLRKSFKVKSSNLELNFSIKNFKCIVFEKLMKLRPITIYCGVNSSGKSSIIQSQLLISQSFSREKPRYVIEEKKIPQIFIFEGHYCHLQDYRNIIFENNINNQLSYKWEFYNKGKKIINVINCGYIIDKDYFTKGYPIVKDIKSDITEKNESRHIIFLLNENNIPSYNIKISDLDLDTKDFFLRELPFSKSLIKDKNLIKEFYDVVYKETFKIEDKRITEINLNNILVNFQSIFPINLEIGKYIIKKIDLDKIFNELFTFDEFKKNEKQIYLQKIKRIFIEDLFGYLDYFVNHLINNCFDPIINYYKKVRYLGPLREEPKRFYSFSDLGLLDSGLKGENTTQVLTIQKDLPVDFLKLQTSKDLIKFSNKEKKSLLNALNEWLKIMNLQQINPKVEMELITKILVNYSKNQPLDSPVSIPDVGFGLSQILPVLVESLRMEKGELLILEQPEIHLHPKMQGDLADFLLCNAYLGKKFIIETHSDHLIKRLCLRIAQFKDIDISKLISIYFIVSSHNNGGSKIIEVNIDEFGRIINWPKGFFDENEDGRLLEESLKKKQYKNQKGMKK